DFLILAGHILDLSSADARALEFLWQLFLRLEREGIDVFWHDCDGDQAARWPVAAPLPANVQIFPPGEFATHIVRRNDQVCAVLANLGALVETSDREPSLPLESQRLTIALGRGAEDLSRLDFASVDYWALGGTHDRRIFPASTTRGGMSGAIQGSCPAETGPHGCELVSVDSRGRFESQFCPLDVVRFEQRRFILPAEQDAVGIARALREQTQRLAEQASGRQILVEWTLVDGDQSEDTRSDVVAAGLRQGGLGGEWMRSLNAEFGATIPGVWTLSITAEPPSRLPVGWYEEDTILGDLLRAVQQYQADPSRPWDPTGGASPTSPTGKRSDWGAVVERMSRETLLREVAALGVDLLRGDRVLTDDPLLDGTVH
ncbi:MAG TPA: hypothetical protein VIY86_09490, partial [Pirellulaceae bacterium]